MNAGMILVQRLRSIEDPRVTGRCDHALVDILLIALCATMAGAEGWDDMEAWGEANEERLRLYVELRNGIPSHDTIRRVFEAIDPKQLEAVLLEWVGHVCPALGKVIAIDGKSVRGSGSVLRGQRALHVVSAYASEVGLVLGQQRCDEKSNEIGAIEALLPNLKLAGCIVTIDAMGCQTEIAAQVIERKGCYLLNAKDNQPKLAEAIEEYIRIGEQHAWKIWRHPSLKPSTRGMAALRRDAAWPCPCRTTSPKSNVGRVSRALRASKRCASHTGK
jgi:predicted transposase YbfD/YdcC